MDLDFASLNMHELMRWYVETFVLWLCFSLIFWGTSCIFYFCREEGNLVCWVACLTVISLFRAKQTGMCYHKLTSPSSIYLLEVKHAFIKQF